MRLLRFIQRLLPPWIKRHEERFEEDSPVAATPRCALFFGRQNYSSSVGRFYLRPAGRVPTSGGVEPGYTMPRDGSIVGLAIAADINWDGTSVAGAIDFEIRVNDSTVWTKSTGGIDAGGLIAISDTQAAGTDTFSAGDTIEVSWNRSSGSAFYGVQPIVTVIVEFDS